VPLRRPRARLHVQVPPEAAAVKLTPPQASPRVLTDKGRAWLEAYP
jgi:hypothetical protein